MQNGLTIEQLKLIIFILEKCLYAFGGLCIMLLSIIVYIYQSDKTRCKDNRAGCRAELDKIWDKLDKLSE